MYCDGTILYNDAIAGISHHVIAAGIIVVVANCTKKWKWVGAIASSRIVSFIDKHSYAIYIVHYCIIGFLFARFNLAIATVLFVVWTIVMAYGLDFVVDQVQRPLTRHRIK